MKATVATSKARVEDIEAGDVIRYDTHGGRDKSPKWSNWLRVINMRERAGGAVGPGQGSRRPIVDVFVTFEGVSTPQPLRKLDIVEVQHRAATGEPSATAHVA